MDRLHCEWFVVKNTSFIAHRYKGYKLIWEYFNKVNSIDVKIDKAPSPLEVCVVFIKEEMNKYGCGLRLTVRALQRAAYSIQTKIITVPVSSSFRALRRNYAELNGIFVIKGYWRRWSVD